MRIQSRPMPFAEEQMQQIYNTNLIDFVVQHGLKSKKGDRNTVHVKHSGGLYLFKHGRGYEQMEHYIPPVEKKPRSDLVLPPKDRNMTAPSLT